jgi:hypothetical protein
MAAGLPAIISDWNGYRGGVRDGRDGFLIPTYAPPPAAGLAIAEHYFNQENYGVSLMGAAQSTAVDIDRCAASIRALAEDAAKRQAFGASGRARTRDIYDWRHIIKAYEDLWRDLAEKRRAAPPEPVVPQNWQAVHPAFPNPLQMFRSFPSITLKPEDRMRIVMEKDDVAKLMGHEMNFFLPDLLASKWAMKELVEAIRKAGTAHIKDVLAAFPAEEHPRIWRCIGWMLKHGVAVREA